jgi:hypothetical protein
VVPIKAADEEDLRSLLKGITRSMGAMELKLSSLETDIATVKRRRSRSPPASRSRSPRRHRQRGIRVSRTEEVDGLTDNTYSDVDSHSEGNTFANSIRQSKNKISVSKNNDLDGSVKYIDHNDKFGSRRSNKKNDRVSLNDGLDNLTDNAYSDVDTLANKNTSHSIRRSKKYVRSSKHDGLD